MTFWDPDGSGWGKRYISYGTTSGFGLPPLPGGESAVMLVPATSPRQGIRVTHGASPNGVHAGQGKVSNYTLVFDIYWPRRAKKSFRSLYQADPGNRDDSEMFISDNEPGGLGVGGGYHGRVVAGQWHRIVISVRAAAGEGGVGHVNKFIDGRFVGSHGTHSDTAISRWALSDALLLFADDDGDTGTAFVSSFYFIDRNLAMEDIARLGGPHAKGATTPGPPDKSPVKRFERPVEAVAHRGASCCAPENTLAAINLAIEMGAKWIEVDLQWSKDRQMVLLHDKRVERTTNGKGWVYDYTVAQLKKLDAGSWFDPAFRGERIPTLVEALKAAKGKAVLVLDVKGINAGKAIKAALDKAGVGPEAVRAWQNKYGEAQKDFYDSIPGARIFWGAVPRTLDAGTFEDFKKKGIVGFDVDFFVEDVNREFVYEAQRNGMFVSVYTLYSPDDMRKAADLGVDAIETDFPNIIRKLQP